MCLGLILNLIASVFWKGETYLGPILYLIYLSPLNKRDVSRTHSLPELPQFFEQERRISDPFFTWFTSVLWTRETYLGPILYLIYLSPLNKRDVSRTHSLPDLPQSFEQERRIADPFFTWFTSVLWTRETCLGPILYLIYFSPLNKRDVSWTHSLPDLPQSFEQERRISDQFFTWFTSVLWTRETYLGPILYLIYLSPLNKRDVSRAHSLPDLPHSFEQERRISGPFFTWFACPLNKRDVSRTHSLPELPQSFVQETYLGSILYLSYLSSLYKIDVFRAHSLPDLPQSFEQERRISDPFFTWVSSVLCTRETSLGPIPNLICLSFLDSHEFTQASKENVKVTRLFYFALSTKHYLIFRPLLHTASSWNNMYFFQAVLNH